MRFRFDKIDDVDKLWDGTYDGDYEWVNTQGIRGLEPPWAMWGFYLLLTIAMETLPFGIAATDGHYLLCTSIGVIMAVLFALPFISMHRAYNEEKRRVYAIYNNDTMSKKEKMDALYKEKGYSKPSVYVALKQLEQLISLKDKEIESISISDFSDMNCVEVVFADGSVVKIAEEFLTFFDCTITNSEDDVVVVCSLREGRLGEEE